MKDIINELKFTKKSLLIIGLLLIPFLISINSSIGYENQSRMKLSIAISFVLFILYLIYFIIVLSLYYKLPKHKVSEHTIGVLFYINTRNNKEDFDSFVFKFCDQFSSLSNNKLSIVKPIILSQKQVEVIKNIDNNETQRKLLEKTKCLFGVFIKSTDEGRNSDNYQLQLNAMIIHPKLNDQVQKVFQNNFNYVFKDIKICNLNKQNDLKNLQEISTRLFFLCQFIVGVANSYSGYYLGAIDIYNNIIMQISSDNNSFYLKLRKLTYCEMCNCCMIISMKEYNDYVYKDNYNFELIKKILLIYSKIIIKLNIQEYTIDFHLTKAVYCLLMNNIVAAKEEMLLLDKIYKNIAPKLKCWAYSKAFLCACENNSKKYNKIYQSYKRLKSNNTQDAQIIFDFINTYSANNPTNTGAKIALLLIVHFKELPIELITDDFIVSLIQEIKSQGQSGFADLLLKTIRTN